MENAVEALKMAFAVMLQTHPQSLSLPFSAPPRTPAQTVLQCPDETAYYDYTRYDLPEDPSGNRIVGYETIIPTLYKYDKERYKVTFKKGNYDSSTGELTNVVPLSIYETESIRANWSKNYTNDFDGRTTYNSTYNEMSICSFDIVEETQRNEPWVGNSEQIKLHLDAIFSGGTYSLPQYNGRTIDYSNNPLSKRTNKFVEQIGEVVTTTSTDDQVIGNKTTKKRIITYILIN